MVVPRAVAHKPAAKARPPEGRIEDYMLDHYVITMLSRDAVIGGSLDGLREPLLAFAEHPYKDVATGGWIAAMTQIQEAARLTANAPTLELAATGVATMARSCGECHRQAGGGPVFVQLPAARSRVSDTVGTRMRRHMCAAERLWEGLVGPSDDAWNDGAAVLARISTDAPASDAPLPAGFTAALNEVQALGQQALEASSAAERSNVYGRFLASCASCHSHRVEVEL
jgi:cytochrome c553